MRYLEIDTATRISKVGLGTWQFGAREWGYGEGYADSVARDIVRRAVDLGVTLFDTAEVYGFGRSERILGEALGGRVLTNQVRYSLADRAPEQDLLPFAAGAGRVVIAYSPLAQGRLSGRYDRANRPANRVRAGNPVFRPENLDRAVELIGVLREVAHAHSRGHLRPGRAGLGDPATGGHRHRPAPPAPLTPPGPNLD